MKRNMWKKRHESGERNAKFEALLTAFKYGFACTQRMETNKRKRGAAV